MSLIVGRQEEQKLLSQIIASSTPELVAVYGRRRVGKTYLIRQALTEQIVFEFSGTKDETLSRQLTNFQKALQKKYRAAKTTPANWSDAFELLTQYLSSIRKRKKLVVFLDEFPWINSHKSGFLQAFDYWWNTWGNTQNNLAVIICGSAASWMIQHIINNKAGLHNRITRRIRLMPFTLSETEQYLQSRNIRLHQFQLLQLYMVMGGIPMYLSEVRKGESAAQTIDRTCFTKDGALQPEFRNLYTSLFDDATRHLAVVRVLSANNKGLTRNEIIEKTGLSSGGRISEVLDELAESGFISAWLPYDRKSKDAIYKLSDEYTHFYLKFMDNTRAQGAGTWLRFSTGQSWRSWSGIAYERICLKHIPQIKNDLGISVIYTEESAWRFAPKGQQGAQIDLLIERRDLIIHLCEIKFSETPYTITKKYAAELENKKQVFLGQTKGRKSVFITMITTFGVQPNDYAANLVQNSVTMEALFRQA
ncbi:MAG: ATP-binding protein [Chitinophagaceae bacterium]|nr:MAG: ATP-binding protein [Chitinophagaceae bacterium]